jgi:hypothetical protein
VIIETRTDGDFDPCIGGGSSRDCERGECNARAMCAAASPTRERIEHDASTFGDMARGVRVYLRNDGSRREEPWEDA